MPLDLNNLLNSTPVSPPHTTTTTTNDEPEGLFERSEPLTFSLPPATFNGPSTVTPQTYQTPVPITSFSYDDQRHIRCGSRQFHSLRPLLDQPSRAGFDLNQGRQQAVFQDRTVDEGLDGLLISLYDLFEQTAPEARPDEARGVLLTDVITWRGMLAKMCGAVYERGRGAGWAMNAMMVAGTLYIEDVHTPDTAEPVGPSYFGYAYEALLTHHRFLPVNTNAQWVAVVKTRLNHARCIIAGEVDAVDPHVFDRRTAHPVPPRPETISPAHFVEIKTSVCPAGERDCWNLYRHKMLKFWLQSYLLGTPKIHVGLRDRAGIVQGSETYATTALPQVVRERGPAGARWSSTLCLASGTRVVGALQEAVSGDGRQRWYEGRLAGAVGAELARRRAAGAAPDAPLSAACTAALAALHRWPVFRLAFQPGEPLLIRPLDPVAAQALSANKSDRLAAAHGILPPGRLGFLPAFWAHHLVRLTLATSLQKPLPSSPVPTPP